MLPWSLAGASQVGRFSLGGDPVGAILAAAADGEASHCRCCFGFCARLIRRVVLHGSSIALPRQIALTAMAMAR